MTAVLYTNHFVQFFDSNGAPLSNGKLYAYSAGTTTPKATYTTEEAITEHAHPIVLDSAGRQTIFIQGSYRFDLYDANDALIRTTDNVTSFTTLNEAGDPFFQSFSGTGSQTVFTLSESLGSDSKDIMVFVDAGGSEGFEIQNPSAYTLSGTSLTFNSAPASGTGNIYVFAPTKLLGAAAASAAAAASSEAAAASSATDAETAQTAAETAQANVENVEARLVGIASASSVAIGTGTKTFTVAAGLGFSAGQFVLIDSDADGSNYMSGQITSYSSTTLEVNVSATGGSGTYADWTITVSGVRGETGATGATGTVSATSGVQAATTAGAALKSSNGNDCISWGAGGSANSTLNANMSGASTYKLVNMADPSSAQDYATKNYVDTTRTVSQGGTGATSLTANNVILGNGTSAVQFVAPSTSGNVLTSNGTTWTSAAPDSGWPTPNFTSSALTPVADSSVTAAHGLGAVPTFFTFRFVCNTNDGTFVAGETIRFWTYNDNSGTPDGFLVMANSTNVEIITENRIILPESDGSALIITLSSWRVYVEAWS